MKSGSQNKDRALLSGTPESTELTENQNKVINILTYFGKIAMTTAQTPVSSRVRKPNGMKEMTDAILRDGKKPEELTPAEFEKYEKELWDVIEEQTLGGQSNFMQFLLLQLTGNEKFRKMVDDAAEEAITLGNKRDYANIKIIRDDSSLT